MNLDGSSTRFEEGIQAWCKLAELTAGQTLEEVAYLCVLAHHQHGVKTKLPQYQNLWAFLRKEGPRVGIEDPGASLLSTVRGRQLRIVDAYKEALENAPGDAPGSVAEDAFGGRHPDLEGSCTG